MRLKDLKFHVPPHIEAVRRRAKRLDAPVLDLSRMMPRGDISETETASSNNPEVFIGNKKRQPNRFVVKPGHTITDLFSDDCDPRNTKEVLAELRRADRNPQLRPYVDQVFEKGGDDLEDKKIPDFFEQGTRERLFYLLADAVGLGDCYAPVLLAQGRHNKFFLSASLCMGPLNGPINLSRNHVEPTFSEYRKILSDNPKLWSLICASIPFRTFVADIDNKLESYILVKDKFGEASPYAIDGGDAFQDVTEGFSSTISLMGTTHLLSSLALDDNENRISFPFPFDKNIMVETTERIYALSRQQIREIVTSVANSVPIFSLDRRSQSIRSTCRALFNYREQLGLSMDLMLRDLRRNHQLELSGIFPSLPSASPIKASRPTSAPHKHARLKRNEK